MNMDNLFHLRFESIHPFIDGNGRTGRLIMDLELLKEGSFIVWDGAKDFGLWPNWSANT